MNETVPAQAKDHTKKPTVSGLVDVCLESDYLADRSLLWSLSIWCRDGEGEGGSLSQAVRFGVNTTAVSFNESFSDAQSQSCAFDVGWFLDCGEWFEDASQILRLNSDARVCDCYNPLGSRSG